MDTNIPEEEFVGPIVDYDSGKIFLSIVLCACDTILACGRLLDSLSLCKRYGTELARGANAIKNNIQENKIEGRSPYAALKQISCLIESSMNSIHGKAYAEFIDAASRSFSKYSATQKITADMWLNALSAGNNALEDCKDSFTSAHIMLYALKPAELCLAHALSEKSNPMYAFNMAVKAAEESRNITVFQDSSITMAVGMWMRGAYEATKLKLSYYFYKDY